MKTDRIDHFVLTIADIGRSVSFYRDVLGMRRIEFGDGRIALGFGRQKINLQRHGREFEPKAARVQPGSADLCLIVDDPLEQALAELERHGVEVIDGGRGALVHCSSGKDRTGLALCHYLCRREGYRPPQAVAELRRVRPISLSACGYEEFALEVLDALEGG